MKWETTSNKQAQGRWLVLLFVAWVLLPLWMGFPLVLDDSRLDGGVLGFLAGITALMAIRRRVHLPPGSLLLLLGFACSLPVLATLPWTWSVSGLADRAPWIASWALLVIAYSAPRHLQRAWKWVFLGGALAAGYELLQLLGWDPFALAPAPGLPPTPPLSSRAHAGEFLSVFIVAGAAWFTFIPSRKRYSQWLLLLGPAALLAGYFDLLAARLAIVSGLALLVWKQRTKLLPALLLLSLFAGGELIRSVSKPPFAVRDPGESGLQAWSSLEGRALMYEACAIKSTQTPFGIGFGRFERDYPGWRPLEEQRLSSSNYENITSRRPKTPHNEPLLVLVEFGWLGFLFLTFAVVKLLRLPGRNSWTYPALLALAIHVLVRSPLSDNGPLLALAVLLLSSWNEESSGFSRNGTSRIQRFDFLSRLPANIRSLGRRVLPISCAALALLPAPSQFFGELAVAKRLPLDEQKKPSVLEAAVKWRPWDSRAWGLLAADYSRSSDQLEMVPTALVEALRFDPSDLFALNAYFKLEMNRGNEETALAFLAVAEFYSPDHPALRANRTLYLRSKSNFHRLNGIELLGAKAQGAAEELRLAQLLMAMAEIRDQNPEKAKKALRAAATYSAEHRALIERMSRDTELSEKKLYALLQAIQPNLAPLMGSRRMIPEKL